MTIKVYADRIEIGAKTITTTPTGIRIGDSLAANTQQQGYINQANFTARELAFGNFVFQGSVAGFSAGGFAPPYINVIDKFPFAIDTNATDVGDLTESKYNVAGQSSTVSGYRSGGGDPVSNVIDKFPFATNGNATDVGDLTVARDTGAGLSSSTFGYQAGGENAPTPPGFRNHIDKFPFATDTNATDVGDLSGVRRGSAGQSSTISGYVSGGYSGPPAATNILNTIEKFPFAADTNVTNVGDLTVARERAAGQSSTVSGYTSGGFTTPPATNYNTIDKFLFASDTNASDVGDLDVIRGGLAGQSSTVSGYSTGGTSPPPAFVNTIDKFPFSADTNATDVGDLTQVRTGAAGQQF